MGSDKRRGERRGSRRWLSRKREEKVLQVVKGRKEQDGGKE